jgi:putative two-component system response regulator
MATIELMHWHDSFSVGVRIIDEQHQQLFNLINELIVTVNTQQQDEVIESILYSVLTYTEMHFRTEEELVQIHPQYIKHCSIHKKFAEDIDLLLIDFKENRTDAATKLLEKLTEWLKKHILKTDIAFFSELGYRPKETKEDAEERLQLLTHKVKVLVAEDHPSQRMLLKKNLETAGYDVLEASNGEEALRILETNYDLHLLITDMYMPIMDGQNLIKAIRDKQILSVYIIAITATHDQELLVKTFNNGANDYLTKPIFYQELHLRLRNGLNLLRLENQDELILSMAKLADCRSPETGLHLDRVQNFTRLLSRQLISSCPDTGMTESIAADIARFSPLHDIGKVAIADNILKKPGRLTNEEFDLMKEHAKIGGDLISSILRKTGSKNLRIAFELTMYHHEKWDGSGYPLGLSGKDIPIAAQVMALADVYDAVTSKRIYKKAFSREEARSIIVNSAGNHFDPALVDAFELLEDKFHQLRIELQD